MGSANALSRWQTHPRHLQLMAAAAPGVVDFSRAVARAQLIAGIEPDITQMVGTLLLGGAEKPSWHRVKQVAEHLIQAQATHAVDATATFTAQAEQETALATMIGPLEAAAHAFPIRGFLWRHSDQCKGLQRWAIQYAEKVMRLPSGDISPKQLVDAAILAASDATIADTLQHMTLPLAPLQKLPRTDDVTLLSALAPYSATARKHLLAFGDPKLLLGHLQYASPWIGANAIASGHIGLRATTKTRCDTGVLGGALGAMMIMGALAARGDTQAMDTLRRISLERQWDAMQTYFSTSDHDWWSNVVALFRVTHVLECLNLRTPQGVKNPFPEAVVERMRRKVDERTSTKRDLAAVTLAFLSAYDLIPQQTRRA